MSNVRFTAEEIVRAMTPAGLNKKQKEYLLYTAEIVLTNHLNKADLLELYEVDCLRRPKVFKIWAEGYVANETEGFKTEPVYLGESAGNNFQHACEQRFRHDSRFCHKGLTYWGCKLSPERPA